MDKTQIKTEFIKNWESGFENKFKAMDIFAEWASNTKIYLNSKSKQKGVPDIAKSLDTYLRFYGFKQFREEHGLDRNYDLSDFIEVHISKIKQKSPKFYSVFTAAVDHKIKAQKNKEKIQEENMKQNLEKFFIEDLPEKNSNKVSISNNEVDDICRILEKVKTSVEITTPTGWVVVTK